MGLFDVFKKKEEKQEEEKKQETVAPATPKTPAAGRTTVSKSMDDALADKLARSSGVQAVAKTTEEAKEKAQEIIAEVKAKAEEVKEEVTEKVEEAKEKVAEVVAEVKTEVAPKTEEEKEAERVALAKQVIRGDWGNGKERKDKLEAAGYDYATVQGKVNELLGIKPAEPKAEPAEEKKSVEEIAREVIRGKWGNGGERKKRLEEAGYSYVEVQNKVNQLLSKK